MNEKKPIKETPHYHGHRKRLREKLLAYGGEKLPDYELLELVLSIALPRRDVKPLAKVLLERFGSFAKVISAEPIELTAVDGIKETTASVLKIIQASVIRLLRDEISNKPILNSWDRMVDYCTASMGYNKSERFRILFLDVKNRLIADELQQKGTVNHTPVYPREVIKRALELGASSIIMVHNHPNGDPKPSKADIEMTRLVKDAGRVFNITLHDHVIVTKNNFVSFKSIGLL